MTDKIIPPRRGEEITPGGTGNTRFMEYLEENARQTNNATDATEGDVSSINMSSAGLAFLKKQITDVINEGLTSDKATIEKLNKKIANLESNLLSTSNSKLLKRIEELENAILNQSNGRLLKRIQELENNILSVNNSKLLKRIENLESDLIAPISQKSNMFDEITVDIINVTDKFQNGTMTIDGKVISVAGNSLTLNSGDTTADNPLIAPILITQDYTVAGVPGASGSKNGVITVSDEVGGFTLAFSDGTDWRRVQDRAIIS